MRVDCFVSTAGDTLVDSSAPILGIMLQHILDSAGHLLGIADARDLASPVNFGPFRESLPLGAIPIASALRRLAWSLGR